MRYWGQNYEQDVPMPPGAVTPELLEATLDEFHRLHEQFYGYSITGEVIELIRFNATVSGHTDAVTLPAMASNGHFPGGQPVSERPVYFQGHGLIDTPIYRRRPRRRVRGDRTADRGGGQLRRLSSTPVSGWRSAALG